MVNWILRILPQDTYVTLLFFHLKPGGNMSLTQRKQKRKISFWTETGP